MLSFYSVKLNSFEMQVFNSISNKLSNNEFRDYMPHNYTYLNLNELATQAKNNSNAKEELFKRVLPRVTSILKKYYRNYKLSNYGELYKYTMDGLEGILNSYSQSKGAFINFLSKSINRVLYFRVIKILKEKNKKKSWIGNEITDEEKFLDIKGDCPDLKTIALKVDLIDYISKLKKDDRKILMLYLKGFTISEIASYINYSPASISIKVRKTLNDWKRKNIDV